MNVMKQLSQLPETSPTYLQSFHKSALHFLEQKKNYQVIEKDTFSCAIVRFSVGVFSWVSNTIFSK